MAELDITCQVAGVREAIRSLNRIEPGLRKQFQQEANRIAEPAIRNAQAGYVEVPLSGMERNWTQGNRKVFPFSVAKARRGVKLKLDARREATAVILITQTDRAAAVFETAGRRNPNPLGRSLGPVRPGRTRIIGPAVYRARPKIEREMQQAAVAVVRRVEKELN